MYTPFFQEYESNAFIYVTKAFKIITAELLCVASCHFPKNMCQLSFAIFSSPLTTPKLYPPYCLSRATTPQV